MQAIREIKKVTERKVTIDIPEDFDANEVEVIVMPYNDVKEKEQDVDFSKYFGVMDIENVDEEIDSIRNEWGREWDI